MIEWAMLGVTFVAGMFVGDWFGKRRAAFVIQRGINAGRFNLTVSRPFRRRMARDAKLRGRR